MESKPQLKYIFANINDWLKFAEAKHDGLIAQPQLVRLRRVPT